MNITLKYFLIFGSIAVVLSAMVVNTTSNNEEGLIKKPTSEIKEFSYDNGSVRCFYIDNNGVKSYLSCVQSESQTVLK